MAKRNRYCVAFLVGLTCLAILSPLPAQTRIDTVSPRSATIGETTKVRIRGEGLSPGARLALPHGLTATVVSETNQQVEFDISVPDEFPCSVTPAFLASDLGASQPFLLTLDTLPAKEFSGVIDRIPTSLTHDSPPADRVSTSFRGEKGQSIVIEVESRRLGSNYRPVVRLFDSDGRQVGAATPRRELQGDSRLTVTLPRDDKYTIEIHDQLFRPQSPSFFRLKVGAIAYADTVFPLAVENGKTSLLSFLNTNLPASARAKFSATDGRLGEHRVTLFGETGLSGPTPSVIVSDFPEWTEARFAASGQATLTAPFGLSGVIENEQGRDRIPVSAAPGTALRISVVASRVGSALDPVLEILNEQGGVLAAQDDTPGSADPSLEFQTPAEGRFAISIRDLRGRGGPSFVYRVSVTPTDKASVNIKSPMGQLVIPERGTALIPMEIERRNYGKKLRIQLDPPIEGLSLQNETIGPESTIGLVAIRHDGKTRVASQIRLRAASENGEFVPREVSANPRFPGSLGAEFRNVWNVSTVHKNFVRIEAAPTSHELPLGAKLSVPLIIHRADLAKNLRVRLLTTQVVPKKKVIVKGPDGRDKEEQRDDLDRAIRLEGDLRIPSDVTNVVANVLIPPDLPVNGSYDLVFVVDVMNDNNVERESVASTVAMNCSVSLPFELQFNPPQLAVALAGEGNPESLNGSVLRKNGYTGSIRFFLEGLPAGLNSPSAQIAEGANAFQLPLRLPYGLPPSVLSGVTLVAQSVEHPTIRWPGIPIKLVVLPGAKPESLPPKIVFDEDEAFVAALSEGDGAISLDRDVFHRGTASAKVTPGQRYATNAPGLGIKIRKTPDVGEYRYLRFAWKKRGGDSICLQLNHDGAWGPGEQTKPGATFRYHAGKGAPCYGAALVVADTIPSEFVVVTRDLYEDFGEFTWNGLALSAVDGEAAWFDSFELAQRLEDFGVGMKP